MEWTETLQDHFIVHKEAPLNLKSLKFGTK